MEKRKGKRKMILNWTVLALIIVGSVLLLLIFPDKKDDVVRVSMDFLIEMILILPAVMILLGLFAVWVPGDIVVKFLGRASGAKGVVLSIILGALPTGPLYIAFPIAAALLRKGAKVSNIIIFLSAWACIKIPQELVELQFLGARFMALRLVLTIIFVIIMGLVIEKIMKLGGEKDIMVTTAEKARFQKIHLNLPLSLPS